MKTGTKIIIFVSSFIGIFFLLWLYANFLQKPPIEKKEIKIVSSQNIEYILDHNKTAPGLEIPANQDGTLIITNGVITGFEPK